MLFVVLFALTIQTPTPTKLEITDTPIANSSKRRVAVTLPAVDLTGERRVIQISGVCDRVGDVTECRNVRSLVIKASVKRRVSIDAAIGQQTNFQAWRNGRELFNLSVRYGASDLAPDQPAVAAVLPLVTLREFVAGTTTAARLRFAGVEAELTATESSRLKAFCDRFN